MTMEMVQCTGPGSETQSFGPSITQAQ